MNTLDVVLHDRGDGKTFPRDGDTVFVLYKGILSSTGEEFDSNWNSEEGLQVLVGNGDVIRGWDIGLKDVPLNAIGELRIPARMAYGSDGYMRPDGNGYAIPPDSDLIFTVKMLRVERKNKKVAPVILSAQEKQRIADSWTSAATTSSAQNTSNSRRPTNRKKK